MKPDHEVIVIGCGIMGATISKALRGMGLQVCVIDDRNPVAGTPASGGHVKWEWTKGLTPMGFDNSLKLLSQVWGVCWEEYEVWPTGKRESVYRVDTNKVMEYREDSLEGKVNYLTLGQEVHRVGYQPPHWTHTDLTCRSLILCAGIGVNVWSKLYTGTEHLVTPKQGISFRYRATLRHPIIHQYAPYKQVVCHQQSDREVWCGEGTAILPTNWTISHEDKAEMRCWETMHKRLLTPIEPESFVKTIGIRPYPSRKLPPDQPCIFEQIGTRCWVVTGGAKQSTIAAGWAARRLIDALT